MEEFEDSQLRYLQEVDGIVLRNVHGERVAIGEDFNYENIFDFIIEYFETYGAEDFAKKLGFSNATSMLKHWFSGIPETENDLLNYCMDSNVFDGIYAEDLADEYDYEHQAYLDAEDVKYAQLAGK